MAMLRAVPRALLAILLLVVVGVVGYGVFGQVRGWRDLAEAKVALEQDDLPKARQLLERCLKSWPDSAEANFYAGRTARREGKLADAVRYFAVARKNNWVKEALDFEHVLIDVQLGKLREHGHLVKACSQDVIPEYERHLILEVLTPAYLMNYHLEHADTCVKVWLELRPDSAQAWHCKAVLADKRQQQNDAVAAFTKELELDPSRDRSRLHLVRLLLDANKPAEALGHLAKLAEQGYDSPEIKYQNVRLHMLEGKHDEAGRILSEVLVNDPQNAGALHLRGKIALDAGKPRDAEPFLREAIKLAPFEPDMLYTLRRCLEQTGNTKEVAICDEQIKRCKAELGLLRDLTMEVRKRPMDPEPRRRVAEVYLRNQQDKEGLRWLLSALQMSPEHAATHRDLAAYYERQGQRDMALAHRDRGKEAK